MIRRRLRFALLAADRAAACSCSTWRTMRCRRCSEAVPPLGRGTTGRQVGRRSFKGLHRPHRRILSSTILRGAPRRGSWHREHPSAVRQTGCAMSKQSSGRSRSRGNCAINQTIEPPEGQSQRASHPPARSCAVAPALPIRRELSRRETIFTAASPVFARPPPRRCPHCEKLLAIAVNANMPKQDASGENLTLGALF